MHVHVLLATNYEKSKLPKIYTSCEQDYNIDRKLLIL